MLRKEKIYIVDYELISPLSVGKEGLFESLQSNTSSDRPITRLNVSALPFKTGSEIQQNLTELYKNESEEVKRLCEIDRKFELICAAYWKAADRLTSLLANSNATRTGVILGVGADAAPYEFFEAEMAQFLHQKLNPIHELILHLNQKQGLIQALNNPYDIYAYYLASKLNAGAFQKSILTACVASTQAIAFGFDALQRNEADVVIAGGTDSIINLLALISFGKLGVIVETKDDISCRPFDVNRSGTVAGEAAGFVVMVTESWLQKNRVQPLAQLIGYGNTLDGFKITAPDPAGLQMARAIKQAFTSAGISAADIDYIQAHGTGTRQNDATELGALKQALGSRAKYIPVSGTKDRHGHAIAAAGIQEICVLLESMKHDFLPGNLNLKQPIDPEMNLPQSNIHQEIKYALSCNFAFGGINTVLAVKNEMK